MRSGRTLLLWLCVFICAASPVGAVITRIYPLADIIADADTMVTVRVASSNRRTHTVTVARAAELKGKAGWTRARWVLAGGDDRTQLPIIRTRLARGRTVVLFVKKQRFALGYVEGTWFRLAPPKDEGQGVWKFVHLEVYLRRTFHGSSADLQRTVTDVIAGRGTAPPPDPEVKPGYGN